MRLALAGAAEMTAVVADAQQSGRGRNGHVWESPPGVGLYVSVVLRPRVPADQLPVVTLLAGVAAAEAVSALAGVRAAIKWPNDVLVGGRKVAGLLCEADLQPASGPIVVAGLGVNVNTPVAALPPRVRFPATSLLAETGRCHDRERLLEGFLDRLRHWMAVFVSAGPGPVLAAWRGLDALEGRALVVTLPDGRCVRGVGSGVSAAGCLVLADGQGSTEAVVAGEIRFDEPVNASFPRLCN